MSDIGVLSHVYTEWNTYLNRINGWLFSVKRIKESAPSTNEPIIIPEDIHLVLTNIAKGLDPNSSGHISTIPLDLRRRLVDRFQDSAGSVSYRLYELLKETQIPIRKINNNDLEILNSIVVSLDDEVTSLYSRMRRNR